ncbi:TIR domain-containing protein [Pseudomonas serbica]
MARIFLSHSTTDERQAVALKHWLGQNGSDDVFLDVDPQRGLIAGERWQEALKRAADRCEAVLFVISPAWAKSKWCLAEFLLTKSLNKRIFGLVLKDEAIGELPSEMTSEWQLCHLVGPGKTEMVTCCLREKSVAVDFLTEGLIWLKAGLQQVGLHAEFFHWPPQDDPERAPYRGLQPLDTADAAIYFGRDAEILQGLDKLRGMRTLGAESLFVILGASDTGKSSCLRPGLLPRLTRDDRHFFPLRPIRPERSPLFGEHGLDMACRLLGECRFGRPIDREHHDMVGPFEGRPNFSGAKQFVYVRYDPDLSQPGLDALGLADIKATNVQTLDSIEHIADIQKVGEAFARKHLNVAEHLRGFI